METGCKNISFEQKIAQIKAGYQDQGESMQID